MNCAMRCEKCQARVLCQLVRDLDKWIAYCASVGISEEEARKQFAQDQLDYFDGGTK